jgi:A/G-specific adenine glycosylase
VVDGNVERVLQRISGKRLAGEELWSAATGLLDTKRAGDFNQAMMELGAVVCTPRAPQCLMCPVMKLCATRGELKATTSPTPQKKREIHYSLHYRNGNGRNGRVLLVQRALDASLMPGMWELPERSAIDAAGRPHLSLRHSITVTNYTVRVWRSATLSRTVGTWTPVGRLKQVPLTGLARKILLAADII